MIEKIDVEKVVKYWQTIAKRDYETMLYLFKGKRYAESLFFGHIILEKILKGLVVEETKNEAPYIHNLTKLAELAECDLTEEEMNLLDEVNDFNIRARYPEYKLQFYKQCDKEYTKKYFDEIIKLYQKICWILKQKK